MNLFIKTLGKAANEFTLTACFALVTKDSLVHSGNSEDSIDEKLAKGFFEEKI